MTLDEAIKHAEEMVEEQEKAAKEWHENQVRKCELVPFAEMDYTHENECKECASKHRQLAEWLKELKDYRERIPSYEAGYNDAKREIALSGEYQRAYERGKKDAEQTRWIPVSEGLPDKLQDVLITFYDAEGEYDVAYMRKTFNETYKAHGSENEFVSSMGETTYADYEVSAWMSIEPYKAESEK